MSTPTIDSAANVLADPSAHADEPRLHAALTRSALSSSEGGVFVATVEVRRTMTGDPQKVYELIADVTRMVEWSPESAGAEWLRGEPGAVGSTFRGDNRRPWVKWSTICTVITPNPGKRFAFAVKAADRPVATWEFEITPRPGGCEVIERTVDQRSLLFMITAAVATGLGRRSVRNRRTMEQTLDALARAVES